MFCAVRCVFTRRREVWRPAVLDAGPSDGMSLGHCREFLPGVGGDVTFLNPDCSSIWPGPWVIRETVSFNEGNRLASREGMSPS